MPLTSTTQKQSKALYVQNTKVEIIPTQSSSVQTPICGQPKFCWYEIVIQEEEETREAQSTSKQIHFTSSQVLVAQTIPLSKKNGRIS